MAGRSHQVRTLSPTFAAVEKMSQSLYVIDGHYQIFRAYYAPYPPLSSPSGEPTKATHAFCATLFSLIRTRRPDYLAMVVDISTETVFRREIDPQYKANRDPAPEDFPIQAERIFSIVEAMGIPILSHRGFEADDLMATIVEQLIGRDIDVFLVSKDKDLEQLLIDDQARLYDVGKDRVLDAQRLAEDKGYTPEQVIDIQTLAGDTVDNIPGVPGVGVKTAAKLVQQWGSARAVLENADQLTPKLKERIKAFADQLDRTRSLVTLRRDVPMTFDLEACRWTGAPAAKVRPIFKELAFTRLVDTLDALAETDDAARVEHKADESAPQRETDYQLVDTPEKLDAMVAKLVERNIFAFDTETTSLRPTSAQLVGISISWEAGTGYYVPLRAAVGDTLPVELVVEKLKPIFEDPSRKKCGQNLKYDIVVLRQIGIEVAGIWFDTLLADFLLDPLRRSHGMNALALDILGHEMIPISDLIGKGKNQITMDQIDTARVCEYAAEDADYTWRLYEHFAPRIETSTVRSLFVDVEMPLVEVLAQMEHNGVALDSDMLCKMSGTMATSLVKLTERIHAEAGYPFNIDSTKQLAVVLFDEQGLEVIRKTKTGRSTDAETLSALVATTDNKIPALVLEYRELTKLKGTYVDTLPDMVYPKTGRIHTSFNQTGAVTGRLSSNDPNLQNIPIRSPAGREIRRAFIAGTADHVLLVADYSQIELRILAHFCGDKTLRQAFEEDQDIHAFVAAQVNDVSIDEVTKDQRSAAKAVNFGIIYGQTPFGLSRSLGIPVAEAKAFIDTYFMRYPGIRLFIDGCIADAKEKGYVETILGRRRPVEELRSRNRQRAALGERVAVNTIIQGSAADLIKRAMIDIHRTIKADARPLKMLIQVHDELVFETPASEAEIQAEMIRDKMSNAIPLEVPIAVDINWAPNWLEGK